MVVAIYEVHDRPKSFVNDVIVIILRNVLFRITIVYCPPAGKTNEVCNMLVELVLNFSYIPTSAHCCFHKVCVTHVVLCVGHDVVKLPAPMDSFREGCILIHTKVSVIEHQVLP